MKQFSDYMTAVGVRESGGDYKCKNSLGYLGKYQFGMARLCDLGLTQRKAGVAANDYSNGAFEWIQPYSEEIFLNDPVLQDSLFAQHVRLLRAQLRHWESGLVAGAHLLGVGGVGALLTAGAVGKDGFGTPITAYISKFSGYELP